jgi:mannose-1-phosphate guanylyltransferase/phosphomannomutase
MVPVVNKPIIEYIIELLRKHGVTDILAVLYFQPEEIQDYLGDGSRYNVKITYTRAEEDYGTAGCVKYAERFLDDTFLVISADVLTDFNLFEIMSHHQERKAQVTVTLTHVQNPLPYGVVITAEDGRVLRFLEKPTWGEVFSDTINTGIYVIEPQVLDLIPPKTEFDFSRDLFPLLLARGAPLQGFIAEGYWRDIGNIEEYRLAHQDILHGEVKISISGERLNLIGRDIWLGEGTRIDPNVDLRGSVIIGRNCRIHEGVRIYDSVLGDGCYVEENASIRSSIVWNHTRLGKNCQVVQAIVADHCSLREGAALEENVVISSGSTIGARSVVKSNVKIWPSKVVEDGTWLSTSLVWGDKWLKDFFADARVTGISNVEVTPEFAAKLGAAFGAYLGKGSYVVTSRDSHNSSRMINRALICGLMSAGVNAEDLGALPIPLVRYSLKSGKEQGGLHTRKSPFEEDLLDILFFDGDGRDLPSGKAKAVERLFLREDFRRADHRETGDLDFPHRIVESYREGFLRHIDAAAIRKGHFKIVIDYAHSAASTIFPSILGPLGSEVVALNSYTDPTKITKTREDFEKSLSQLSNIVVSLRADAGFLLDTGAEKVHLVDEKGSILDGDLSLAVLALLVLKACHPRKIAVTVAASRVIDEVARSFGVDLLKTKTDNRSMMEMAAQEGVDFVGGRKGGFIFPAFQSAFDAMLTVAKILEMMARSESHLGVLVKSIPPMPIFRCNVPCPWSLKGKVMRRLIEETKDMPRELVEGVKVFQGEDWVQIYPDNSRPLFHINAEADTVEQAERIVRHYESLIGAWMKT